MGAIDVDKITKFEKEKAEFLSRSGGWVDYFVQLSNLESLDGKGYSATNGSYHGIYQVGEDELKYIKFYKIIGTPLLGVTNVAEFMKIQLRKSLRQLWSSAELSME